jgi:hypothetical protein
MLMIAAGSARAQPDLTSPVESPTGSELPESVTQTRSATWPLAMAMHAVVGAEPHDRGTPVAFGCGLELLWKARLGGFAALYSSEGTPIAVPKYNNVQQPFLGDRISVPFGLAARPFASFGRPGSFLGRLLYGIDLQLGITVEYVRTSDDDAATAGLHAAVALELPLYGGAVEGGLAVRLGARFMFTPEIHLDSNSVLEPTATTQLFAGLTYYP